MNANFYRTYRAYFQISIYKTLNWWKNGSDRDTGAKGSGVSKANQKVGQLVELFGQLLFRNHVFFQNIPA